MFIYQKYAATHIFPHFCRVYLAVLSLVKVVVVVVVVIVVAVVVVNDIVINMM